MSKPTIWYFRIRVVATFNAGNKEGQKMTYEIWSGPSGNIIGAFPTRNEALDAVREVAERNGAEYVESLALILGDDEATRTSSPKAGTGCA